MERKSVPFGQFKALVEGSGGLEGYASLFDEVDDGRDRVRPGAYTKTLEQFHKNGFMPVAHDWDGLPIGFVNEAREDQKGLWVEIRYHSTQAAQDARTVAAERLAAGKSVALSIGYEVAPGGSESKDGVRDLKELNLYEISMVNVPMLRSAGVTSVKARGSKAADGTYEERIGAINTAVTAYFQQSDPFGADPFDTTEAPDVYAYSVETYPDHVIVTAWDDGETRFYAFPYTVDADGAIILGEPTEMEQNYTPVKGLTIAAHAHEALTVSRAFVDRTKSLADVRAKEGRVLSAGNRQRLAALRAQLSETQGALDGLLAETEPMEKGRTSALAEMARFEAFRARQFVSVA